MPFSTALKVSCGSHFLDGISNGMAFLSLHMTPARNSLASRGFATRNELNLFSPLLDLTRLPDHTPQPLPIRLPANRVAAFFFSQLTLAGTLIFGYQAYDSQVASVSRRQTRMSHAFDIGALEWRPHRPDVARGVFGKTLLAGEVKVTLVRVAPGGAFTSHQDRWGHLFLFLAGEGRAAVGEEMFDVKAETVVTVPPGVAHSYENTGLSDLTLVSINLPPTVGRP